MTRSLLTALALLAFSTVPAHAAMSSPPMTLPGDARAAGGLVDGDTWIVAARDTREAASLARRYRARLVGSVGAHVVPRPNARAVAAWSGCLSVIPGLNHLANGFTRSIDSLKSASLGASDEPFSYAAKAFAYCFVTSWA